MSQVCRAKLISFCSYQLFPQLSGEITVASPGALDRETMSRVTVLLTATDNGRPPLANTVPITVTLTNINDFSPAFELPSYSVSVPEVRRLAG